MRDNPNWEAYKRRAEAEIGVGFGDGLPPLDAYADDRELTSAHLAKTASGAKHHHESRFQDGKRNDELAANLTNAVKKACEANPEKLKAWAKARLGSHASQIPEYPVHALGPLEDAAAITAASGQVDIALAGQSFLGAGALCAQGAANVETLTGPCGLMLYLLTIADSGDGKTIAEKAALGGVREYQENAEAQYKIELAEHESGARDEKPVQPYRIASDATIEGIRRAFKEGVPSQGVFTSEGAVFLSGYGMRPENKMKTAGELNRIWDCGEISVSRGTSERLELYHRRLSMHIMVQPEAVSETINDPVLSGIGFLPRCLLAWPAAKGPRTGVGFVPDKHPEIVEFWDRCKALLPQAEVSSCAKLPVKKMENDAKSALIEYFERMESEAKLGKYRETCKPFALRAAEQACRIAGVLAVFGNRPSIDAKTMKHGIDLAIFSVDSWSQTFGDRQEANASDTALALFEWIVEKGGRVSETQILQFGRPRKVRSAAARNSTLACLQMAGLMRPIAYTRPAEWEIDIRRFEE